jgi:hypothetical protein
LEQVEMREMQKKLKPRYEHTEPKFRATPSPREAQQWRKSVYYWWWRYLRLNEDYRRCCESKGRGSMRAIYKDFGNVFDVDFRTWWLDGKRGETLFAEPAATLTLRELHDAKEWDKSWNRKDVMVISVPLNEPKWLLTRWFSRLLKDRHSNMVGKVKKQDGDDHRSVCGKYSVKALEAMCKVYELRLADSKMPLARLGKKAGIQIEFGSKPKKQKDQSTVDEEIYDEERERNVMASTVSRYLKKADCLITNVGKGEFPSFK